jgi:hypothetical protein
MTPRATSCWLAIFSSPAWIQAVVPHKHGRFYASLKYAVGVIPRAFLNIGAVEDGNREELTTPASDPQGHDETRARPLGRCSVGVLAPI